MVWRGERRGLRTASVRRNRPTRRLPTMRDTLSRRHSFIQRAQARQTHRRLPVALNGSGGLRSDGQGSVENLLVVHLRRTGQPQYDQRIGTNVRGHPDRHPSRAVGRLDLDPSTVRRHRVVPGRRSRHQPEVESRFSRRLTNGTDEVAVQWELPARMHLLELGHDRMQPINEHSCSRSPTPVVNVIDAGSSGEGIGHGPMMPRASTWVQSRGRFSRQIPFRRCLFSACRTATVKNDAENVRIDAPSHGLS